jgi:D-arabinose 5-phosphate isomerase GutQ
MSEPEIADSALPARAPDLVAAEAGRSVELDSFAACGARLVLLTAAPHSPLATLADLVAVRPDVPGADPGGIVARGSNPAAAGWGDALPPVLVHEAGYDLDDVRDAHPAGAVGERRGR